jgi:hypothetical protein
MGANTYRPLSERAKALYGDSDFEHEFSAPDERDLVGNGHLAIVPRPYKVLVGNFTVDGKPVAQDSTVELALALDNEAALLAGGFLACEEREARPSGNASRDEWAAYALSQGATEADLLDADGDPLGRNELRDKFAK